MEELNMICQICGAELDSQYTTTTNLVRISPCPHCHKQELTELERMAWELFKESVNAMLSRMEDCDINYPALAEVSFQNARSFNDVRQSFSGKK